MVVDDGPVNRMRPEISQRTLIARRESLQGTDTFQLEVIVDGDDGIILNDEDTLAPENSAPLQAALRGKHIPFVVAQRLPASASPDNT